MIEIGIIMARTSSRVKIVVRTFKAKGANTISNATNPTTALCEKQLDKTIVPLSPIQPNPRRIQDHLVPTPIPMEIIIPTPV